MRESPSEPVTGDAAVQIERRRSLSGTFAQVAWVVGVMLGLFVLYGLFVGPVDPWVFRAGYLSLASSLIFFYIPAFKRSRIDRPSLVDFAWVIAAFVPLVYLLVSLEGLYRRAGGATATFADVVVGTIAVLVVLETTRRAAGLVLALIAVAFVAYAYFGDLLPGLFWNRGYSYERIISFLNSTVGIYTSPLGVSARYVFIFIFFGALLQRSGAGDLFVDLAKSAVGNRRGGIAKVPLVSSILFGTISGAAVANVVTTGSLTIPAMKRERVPAHTAGAIEAVASTGGQLMPPVMGAAAFLMVEALGVSYGEIVVAALIPACLYYLGLYFMIDFEADKVGFGTIKEKPLPILQLLRTKGHLLLPLVAVIYFLIVERASPNRAALVGILVTVVVSWLQTGRRLGPLGLAGSLADSSKGVMEIAATTAAAGIIIGILSLTGLGVKSASIIIAFGNGELLPTLAMGMVICIILGLGLPTVAAYAMTAVVVPPAFVALGVSELSAHMFVFYFCVLATITPPVAIASFAAAAVARANMWAVGFKALVFALSGFLIPYMFIYSPALLAQAEIPEMVWAIAWASLGILSLAGAVQGRMYFIGCLGIIERIAFGCVAGLVITHGLTTDIAGLSLFITVVGVRLILKARQRRLPVIAEKQVMDE